MAEHDVIVVGVRNAALAAPVSTSKQGADRMAILGRRGRAAGRREGGRNVAAGSPAASRSPWR
jgi:hypothetical protein